MTLRDDLVLRPTISLTVPEQQLADSADAQGVVIAHELPQSIIEPTLTSGACRLRAPW